MNDTIKHQVNHRSIRKFKDTPLTDAQLDAILSAASHTPTYTFLQSASIIGVTDKAQKQAIAAICKQPYVAECAYLFIIVADLYRDVQIAEAQGVTPAGMERAERFFPTFYDATLMTMNMVTAAESMDLGCVILGSINNDMQAMIDLLNLPPYTFPCLGLAVGVPDQEPALKPRLPRTVTFMENTYQPLAHPLEDLAEYDNVVHEYYDLRDTTKPVDTFTAQMADRIGTAATASPSMLEVLQKQGFLKE